MAIHEKPATAALYAIDSASRDIATRVLNRFGGSR
jgi:hypothetical protein